MAKSRRLTRKKKIGRPKGAKTYKATKLEVRSVLPLSRAGKLEPLKGIRRLVLETRDEDDAVALERLASMVKRRDKKLMEIIRPKKRSKAQAS